MKAIRKQKFCFAVHIADLIPICLQSDFIDLEQVMTHYDCYKKVSVQFFPTDTRRSRPEVFLKISQNS